MAINVFPVIRKESILRERNRFLAALNGIQAQQETHFSHFLIKAFS
jgi:hypothetical protein